MALDWVAETYNSGAAAPSNAICTPARFAASGGPDASSEALTRDAGPIPAQKMVTISPGATGPAKKVAALTTAVTLAAGGGGVGAASRQRIRRLVQSEKQTRPFASRAT